MTIGYPAPRDSQSSFHGFEGILGELGSPPWENGSEDWASYLRSFV
jgi:hypothetical protein